MFDLRREPKIWFGWLAPLIFFQVYLSVTVLAFFFGPWPWDIKEVPQIAAFLVAAQVVIALGYLFSLRAVQKDKSSSCPLSDLRACNIDELRHFFRVSLCVGVILFIPTSLSRTGALFPNIIYGAVHVGEAYNNNYYRLESGNGFVVVEYIRILFSCYLQAIFPLLIFLWRFLGKIERSAGASIVVANIAIYVATGTNKGIADFIVIAPWFVVMASLYNNEEVLKKLKRISIMIAPLIVVFLIFFGIGQAQREGGVGENSIAVAGYQLIEANSDGYFSSLLTTEQRVIFDSLTRYISSGYYAWSECLLLDHRSTLGFGNSMFLSRNADFILGTDFFVWDSLPGLLERQTGWGMFTLWHSIYPWLASDFGEVGTLIVMGGFGYLFGLSWGRSITAPTFQSILVCFLMFVLFYYIPANNQVFQSGETCFAFLFIATFGNSNWFKRMNLRLSISLENLFRAWSRA